MSPNDQYQYYYNPSDQSAGQTNDYTSYQSRSNQYSQNARQASSSNPIHNYNYQPNSTAYAAGSDQAHGYSSNQGWYSTNTQDGSHRAAETLSRMGTTAPSYPSTTATASYTQPASNSYGSSYNQPAATTQYSSTGSNQSISTYPSPSFYGTATATTQKQARPSSVNSTRSNVAPARSPVTETTQQSRPNAGMQHYHHAQLSGVQRAPSPAQIQASQQLQRMQAEQSGQEPQSMAAIQQTYVDPSAVYDAWPEHQRKLAAAQIANDAEQRANTERDAKAKREAEAEAEAEAERLEEERLAKQQEDRELKKAEAAQRRAAAKENGQPLKKKSRKSKEVKAATTGSNVQAAAAAASGVDMSQLAALASDGGDAEAQIRNLMALVKTMNDKHPTLLAKIWEEERQEHMQKTSEPKDSAAPDVTPETVDAASKKKKKKKAPKEVEVKAQPEPATQVQEIAASVPQAVEVGTTSKSASAQKATTASKTAKPSTANGTTIWPPEKKGLLAATAAKWLLAIPENRGHDITADQVSKMLDKNPTYIQLCEMIESHGLKLERASFARALLSGVPDVNSNRSAASPAIPPPQVTGSTQAPSATPAPNAAILNSKKPADNQASTLAVQPPIVFSDAPDPVSPYYDSQGLQIPTAKPPTPKTNRKQAEAKIELSDTKSERPSETPGPVTKEEAARKRTFADLVDLTTLSDDDDRPPAKQAYFGPPPEQPGRGAYSSGLDYLPNFDGVVDPYLQQTTNKSLFHQQQNQMRPGLLSNAHDVRLQGVELAQSMDKKNVLRRSRYDTKTLARDVLLATGRHPDLLPLNAHLDLLRSLYPSQINLNTDLATLRWDLIDPGDAVPAALEFLANDDADSVVNESDAESDHGTRAPFERIPASQTVSMGRYIGEGSFQATRPPSEVLKVTPSRGRGRGRGRPAGISRFSTGGVHTPIGNHTAGGAQTTATPGSGGSGYSSFNREMRPDGTKRRGRPVGWRKNLHQRGIGSPGNAPTSGARPDPAIAVANDPSLPVFKCEWKGCSAELQNLDTLRRHILKMHGIPSKSGKFTCLWLDCGKRVQALDVDSGAINHSIQPFNFPDVQELMKHVETSHLGPVAWRLGDGPPSGFANQNASDSEPYLNDSRGRRVTPTIDAAPSESAPTSTPRQPGQRGRPPKKSEEEKARETQAELARRKREIGLGVDREGATLANEKRRAGFIDDEDGTEVVLDASD